MLLVNIHKPSRKQKKTFFEVVTKVLCILGQESGNFEKSVPPRNVEQPSGAKPISPVKGRLFHSAQYLHTAILNINRVTNE